ncbi:sugar porter family MFS transporter [Microbacterium sp. EYE_5]|uniref:sugar porter family MFS transporter n=1 Tax=unclassified Microbacterium TaxID=2609290 RepID=UPI002005DDA4|nr:MULTISPECIES: sugar porter family MFS transporter [unclassified Microbacterium]MCK6079486.1 sugar porter family MFS transporter [Microbacterium sp. EYE_382]MCK6084756.1 sugar porter family MFS transporter [Microbacterium sp. EYE_384]MCK6123017.1 sugar porter family MFS transporter [Microbacterium sp. EYE_80]MCK6125520.1 sugar porter family MFS transporter [Microbacterium sp. EYE_79]MCK6140440.1 sugar porter family MFS transporter [Microbacterium sp. EYE_39]
MSTTGTIPADAFSMKSPYGRRAIGLSVAAAVGGFLFGFDSSVINGAVDSIEQNFELNSVLTGFVVAVALLGCAAGAVLAGGLSDRWGRLKTMMLGAVMFLVSSIGSGLTFSVPDLIVWRIIGGIGIGIASVVAPAYIAEIAPRQIRGSLASLQQLAITLGIFAALLSDAMLANSAGGASEQLWLGLEAWRWMFLVGIVPAAVYGILAFTMPESPRYLLAKGRTDEAREIFARLVPQADLDKSVNEIRNAIEDDRKSKGASLRGPVLGLQGIVWVGIILSTFQQFVGINVIFYYSTTLWKAVGFDESNSLLISVITSVTNVVVTLIAIWLVDRVGRKPILLTGSVLMTLSLATMAIAFAFAVTVDGEVSLPGAWGPIALVAANLFVVGFGASWGPLVWVLLGEIFPSRIRGKALGVAAGAQWIANFLITVSFPAMSGWSLPLTYGMYALFAALSFVYVAWRVPETKGMELEQTETLFVRKPKERAGR